MRAGNSVAKKSIVRMAMAMLVIGAVGGLTATPALAATTYGETTGGVTHTWTNYFNAGGTEGPTIAAFTTVQIACTLTGFRVADGNTWWYRIASSPWNSSFYASADAFYNNGQTSGSLHGTPFVDPAVANCDAPVPQPQPQPPATVTLAQGPVAPKGFRYSITLQHFSANQDIAVNCYDTRSTGGFFPFAMHIDGSGNAFTQSQCYSADGPDHWVTANGVGSNHVTWGGSSSGGGTGGTGGQTGSGGSTVPSQVQPPKISTTTNEHWAGYAAVGDAFTFVQGTWVVPKVSCRGNTHENHVFIWVGIGGYKETPLLQAGSYALCKPGYSDPGYAIVWETWPPNPAKEIAAVSPGDVVTTTIRCHPGSDAYSIAITVNGTQYDVGGTFKTSKGSAECIVEAVLGKNGAGILPLSNFGTTTFTRCVAAQNDSSTVKQIAAGATNSFSVDRIDDVKAGVKATTSQASSGGSTWSVTWHNW